MKYTTHLLLVFTLVGFYSRAQNFTWLRGSTSSSITGNYGTQNMPSPSNDPGGRHGCATWVDASGNLWLFGGEGFSSGFPLSLLNDLWKYDPLTNQWTWIRGSNGPDALGVYGTQNVPSSTNEPGAREFSSAWVDAAGNFWLFGGDGFASTSTFGALDDLWKYNPGTNQWTWMKGTNTIDQNGIYGSINVSAASNLPGSRAAGATWTNGNNLFMFGGRGFGATGPSSYLSDFWVYNTLTNNWTWTAGSGTTMQNGIYGTQGVPSTGNFPGSRAFSSVWTDATGNFYLFGGLGSAASSSPSYLNDLWKFNPGAGTWVWLSGANFTGQSGSYNFRGIETNSTVPGGRFGAASWQDQQGNLWMFGGKGYDSTALTSYLNDLFRYNPINNRWTWMKGSKAAYVNGTYGTMGVAAPGNVPGSRTYNSWWNNSTSTLWLMGGEGLDASSSVVNHMNDLWRFDTPCNPDSITSSFSQICSGSGIMLTAFNQFPATVNWYSSLSSTNSIGTGSTLSVPSLSAAGTQSVYSFFASSNSCSVQPKTAVTITVFPLPTLSINGSASVCLGSPVTLTASGATNYMWSNGVSGGIATYTPPLSPPFICTVAGTDAYGCIGTITHTVLVYSLPTVEVTSSHSLICKGNPVTLTATGAVSYSWNSGGQTNSIVVTPTISTAQGTVSYIVTGTNVNGCSKTTTFSQPVSGCLGLMNPQRELQVTLFPNPANNGFRIIFPDESRTFSLLLFDALGKIVFEESVTNGKTEIKTNLPAGVYMYLVKQEDRSHAGKLIIQ